MELIETNQADTLSAVVTSLIDKHIEAMGKNQVKNLYALVMEAIEPALFKEVLKFSRYNQSEAARCLGLSRGTLRTRLKAYFGETYIRKLKG